MDTTKQEDALQMPCNRLPSSATVGKAVQENDCCRVFTKSRESRLFKRSSLHPRVLTLERLEVVDGHVDRHF
jgi:hypothetical protein